MAAPRPAAHSEFHTVQQGEDVPCTPGPILHVIESCPVLCCAVLWPAVLLLGLPLALNNKEIEAGLLGSRLRGFGRASVKRAGYMRWKLGAGESSGVLDIA